jgi:hypothetical protein
VTQSDSFLDHVYQQARRLARLDGRGGRHAEPKPRRLRLVGLPHGPVDLPGLINDHDSHLRLLYIGRAANLRGRILQDPSAPVRQLRARRIIAGLLMPAEGYRTTWKDGVVLVPEDELRLTAWMRRSLRLTWAEHPYPRRSRATWSRGTSRR